MRLATASTQASAAQVPHLAGERHPVALVDVVVEAGLVAHVVAPEQFSLEFLDGLVLRVLHRPPANRLEQQDGRGREDVAALDLLEMRASHVAGAIDALDPGAGDDLALWR